MLIQLPGGTEELYLTENQVLLSECFCPPAGGREGGCKSGLEVNFAELQNNLPLIYISLNKNSNYCYIPRSSKPADTF